MKKITLFTALTCCIVYTQAQTNVWDGSTTSTITTGGKVAIGTATPQAGYSLTSKNTSNTQLHGSYFELINNSTGVQYGIFNNISLAGTSGMKYSFYTGIGSQSVDDAYGIYCYTPVFNSSTMGKRFGIVSVVTPLGALPNAARCAIYGNVVNGGATITVKPNDHRAAFFVGSTEIISSSNAEKAFIINRRDIGVAGTGTDIFRIYGDGRVFATEINVKLATSFPDYVFSPGYQLMPLREVGHFIRLNGHLPNVPTAETVEQEGMNVGEMNRVLVEKIEELTLYLLQQQAEIDSLKQEMIILKQQ